MRTYSRIIVAIVGATLLLQCPTVTAAAQKATAPPPLSRPIQLEVDAREAPRHIYHVRLVIPATPGPLTLVYPKWVAGEHAPTGPIADLAGLRFRVGQRAIEWQRDPVDLFAFHLVVPAGTDAVEAQFDYLAPSGGGVFSTGALETGRLADILAIDGDPLADISVLQDRTRIREIFLGGETVTLEINPKAHRLRSEFSYQMWNEVYSQERIAELRRARTRHAAE